jgi:hypothetical protein
MNLAEKLIVAGLTGRTPPAVPGDQFAFVAYDPDGETEVEVLGEGPTPFLALMAGVRRLAASDDEGDNAQFFDTLPKAVRTSGDRALIGFLQRVAGGNGLSFGTESVYLDDGMAAVRPGARCVFAWDAEPPTQEEAYGLYAVLASRPNTTGRKSRN